MGPTIVRHFHSSFDIRHSLERVAWMLEFGAFQQTPHPPGFGSLTINFEPVPHSNSPAHKVPHPQYPPPPAPSYAMAEIQRSQNLGLAIGPWDSLRHSSFDIRH